VMTAILLVVACIVVTVVVVVLWCVLVLGARCDRAQAAIKALTQPDEKEVDHADH
jgi:hypothetical protein